MKGAAVSILCLALAGVAHPATANPLLVDVLGGHGCVIGPASRAAAIAAGFDQEEIDEFAEAVLRLNGELDRGDYIVLKQWQCEIRLPDEISSRYTVRSPEIVAITSAIDAFADDGWPGCFLHDPATAFDKLNGGGRGSGFQEFFSFVASAIIAGDLRYYSDSSTRAPPSFQVVTGECAKVPDIEAIRQSHAAVRDGFGTYIRSLGAATPCEGEALFNIETYLSAYVQGVDPAITAEDQPRYNAGIWMEYMMITLAAGWRDGMSATEIGTLRPPLCSYP
jgi:hypothetical protein